MATFNVKAWATEWCGYEDTFRIEAESEEEALGLAEKELADMYDLLLVRDGEYALADMYDLLLVHDGEYAEMDNLDEDGEPYDESELTSISTCLVEE